jgi:hypothetical protein
MKFLSIILIGVALISYSCNKKVEKDLESDYLTSFLKDTPLRENTEWVVILPGLGCHGCIQEAELFMKNNIGNKNILFILTSVESLKILETKTGVKIKDQTNVYLDKDNSFNIGTSNAIYPCIVQLDNGNIRAYEFQSPSNGQAFATLQSRIDE